MTPGPNSFALHSLLPTDPDADSDPDESDVCSNLSLPLFSPAPSIGASSRTSYDVSMRSASPAPSVWSITSSLRAQAFKQEYGRGLNNYSEVYSLPADDQELDRLDKQHLLFIEIMGKYPPPLEHIMANDVPGETKACLDLGCGSGSWIMDVAREFPHCSAVAVDLVPMQSVYASPDDLDQVDAHCVRRSMPSNCRSEVDDINLGLEHFYGDFNVVHARLISSGIKDYAALIDQISRVLRPGGLIDVLEFDFRMYDQNHRRIDLETHTLGPPWWPRWLAFASLAVRQRGGSVDAATHLHSWVANNPAFEDIVQRDFWVPVSPWIQGDEFQKRIGEGMRDDILAFLQSGRPLLLGSGLPESLVDELESKARAELIEARSPHIIPVLDPLASHLSSHISCFYHHNHRISIIHFYILTRSDICILQRHTDITFAIAILSMDTRDQQEV